MTMATLDVQPLVLKDIELTIGDGTPDDFRKHVSGVTFTPPGTNVQVISWTGLGANTHTDKTVPDGDDWTCGLDYVQDWDSTNSLSRYLYDHAGETVPATFRPRSGVGPSFTADITIVHGAIGGQVNAFATTSVTLGSTKPVLVPAV